MIIGLGGNAGAFFYVAAKARPYRSGSSQPGSSQGTSDANRQTPQSYRLANTDDPRSTRATLTPHFPNSSACDTPSPRHGQTDAYLGFMPYEWITPEPAPDAPAAELHLWPYRSLLRRDFVVFISGTAAIVLLPLLAVLGSPVLWGLLPFFIIVVAGVWYAINRSYKDGEILEELRIWPDRMTLDHIHPRRGCKSWEANTYWVHLKLAPTSGPVVNYLTLKGSDREVELGTFLSEDERAVLYDELDRALRDAI